MILLQTMKILSVSRSSSNNWMKYKCSLSNYLSVSYSHSKSNGLSRNIF